MPTFNYAAARQAGFSDDQIAQHLASRGVDPSTYIPNYGKQAMSQPTQQMQAPPSPTPQQTPPPQQAPALPPAQTPMFQGGQQAMPQKEQLNPNIFSNVINNAKDIGNGMLSLFGQAGQAAGNLIKHPGQADWGNIAPTFASVGKNIATDIGKTVGVTGNGKGGLQFDPGQALVHDYNHPIDAASWLLPAGKLLKGAEAGKAAEIAGEAAKAGEGANSAQNLVRQAADASLGGGSKEYVARQAVKEGAIPQKQVLLDEGILGHPTETGRIQAAQKSLTKTGGDLASAYKNSDRVFKDGQIGQIIDTKLADAGYDEKSIEFIKNYITRQGNFDLASGDALLTTEKAWDIAKKLETSPPKMLNNPESAKAFKDLALDTARIVRGELAKKVPESSPLAAKYSALRDYMDNGLQDPQGFNMNTGNKGIVGAAVDNMKNTVVNPALQGAYNAAGSRVVNGAANIAKVPINAAKLATGVAPYDIGASGRQEPQPQETMSAQMAPSESVTAPPPTAAKPSPTPEATYNGYSRQQLEEAQQKALSQGNTKMVNSIGAIIKQTWPGKTSKPSQLSAKDAQGQQGILSNLDKISNMVDSANNLGPVGSVFQKMGEQTGGSGYDKNTNNLTTELNLFKQSLATELHRRGMNVAAVDQMFQGVNGSTPKNVLKDKLNAIQQYAQTQLGPR